ncbi:hypothetical protein Q7O_000236 [Pectobacterium carotovorum subsp. carotovorum PCCS1]|nr:hypothetical protein [Pectobacterium carotovorum subsp. carotovorum PCCS1]
MLIGEHFVNRKGNFIKRVGGCVAERYLHAYRSGEYPL